MKNSIFVVLQLVLFREAKTLPSSHKFSDKNEVSCKICDDFIFSVTHLNEIDCNRLNWRTKRFIFGNKAARNKYFMKCQKMTYQLGEKLREWNPSVGAETCERHCG